MTVVDGRPNFLLGVSYKSGSGERLCSVQSGDSEQGKHICLGLWFWSLRLFLGPALVPSAGTAETGVARQQRVWGKTSERGESLGGHIMESQWLGVTSAWGLDGDGSGRLVERRRP